MLSLDKTALRLDVDARLEPRFDFLSDEYRSFYRPGRATAFQAPLWQHMIHERLVPALSATQHTLTLRTRGSGELVAVFPFVVQRAFGVRLLQPADFGVCDYNSVVADPETLEMIAADPALLAAIRNEAKGCDLLMFRKMRSDGFDVARLFSRSQGSAGENAAYSMEVDEKFDDWRRTTMRRKFTKELERLQRQLDREGGPYEHRAVTSEADIRAAFDFLRAARKGRFEEDLFGQAPYFEFYRDYAIEAARQGEAITYVSYAAGQPVAVLFGLAGDGHFHAVLIGAEMETLGKYSLGIQILYQVIRMRHEEGFRQFDMGLGNTGYKSHFRVAETPMRNVTSSRSMRGAAMAMIYHHAKPLKNRLRALARNVR
jgi:CelD/BcsL family acetyltransferase involved in cellulose biosynthesis